MISILSRNFNPEKLEAFLRSYPYRVSHIYSYPAEVLRVLYKVYPDQVKCDFVFRGDMPVDSLKFLLEEAGYDMMTHGFYNEIKSMEMLEYVKDKLYLSETWWNKEAHFVENEMTDAKILAPPSFYPTLQDIKLLRYAMENLGFVPRYKYDLSFSREVKDREVVDILLRYNSPTIVACSLSFELVDYMKTHHGFIPTLEDTKRELASLGYYDDMSRIKELVTSYGYPLSSEVLVRVHSLDRLMFMIDELGVIPNEGTMIYFRWNFGIIKYLHEVHHIPVSPLLLVEDSEDEGDEDEDGATAFLEKRRNYILSHLSPPPTATIVARYDGRCPICYEDCTESIFKCGHPQHLACFDWRTARCSICREELL